jgi:hypothetical protein
MAFAGAFARPPRNSHEVLQPQAYLNDEKIAPVEIPDLSGILAGKYEIYDAGGMGELDVRALLKQYGGIRANDVSSNWQGGSYVVFRRAEVSKPAPADVALLYVSRWKTEKAASQFMQTYVAAVGARYQQATAPQSVACLEPSCPALRNEIATDEGPVIIERWPDNMVIIAESFDESTVAQLRNLLRNRQGQIRAMQIPRDELNSRLWELPAFRELEMRLSATFISVAARELTLNRTGNVGSGRE